MSSTSRLSAAALLVALPVAAGAQPAPTVPAGDSAARVTLSGEIRTRAEWDRPGAPAATDAFTYLRSRVGARVAAAPRTTLVLQVQDSRILGADGRAPGSRFDLHQGYVELAAPWRSATIAVRAGRQEIALGNERLVGVVNWSNTGRTFDAVRVLLAPASALPGAVPRWTATAFAATVEERGARAGAATHAADHALAGLHATRALGAAALDVTLLHDVGGRYRAYDDARRTTLDARLRTGRVLGVGAELEGAVQVGRQRTLATEDAPRQAQDVRAWLAGARLATAPLGARRAVATIGVDALSGDASPADGRYTAFATMYASNHAFYGLMDLVGDPAATTRERGLVDAFATASVQLHRAASLRAELHRLATAAGDDRPLGWEADVALPVRVGSTAGLELGLAAFRAGRAAQAVGLGAEGRTHARGYLQLRAGF
jgi:hypothetical protein